MIRRTLQCALPIPDKRDFVRDLESRGLTRQQVLEYLIGKELLRIRQGKKPSYAGLPTPAAGKQSL